jgi:hypothetical protein
MWTCFPGIACSVCYVSCIFLSIGQLCWLEKRDTAEEVAEEEVMSLLRGNDVRGW